MPLSPTLPLLLPAVDPTPVEVATEAAGHALEQALLPLHLYCERVQGRADLSDYQVRHVLLIRAALDQVADYFTQTQQLLTVHRANVAGLNAQLHHALDHSPPLEKACQVDWERIACDLLDRFCRLPTGGAPPLSPLVARIRQSPAFQHGQQRLAAAPRGSTTWPPTEHADAA